MMQEIHKNFQGPILETFTLPKTNAAPENRGPLEKEIPDLETTIFRGELLVLGSVPQTIVCSEFFWV